MKTIIFMLLWIFASPIWAADIPVEPVLVKIPGGEFLMGSILGPTGDGELQALETPVHPVAIKSFMLSKYEVTVGQFRQFIQTTKYKTQKNCWRLSNNDWGMESAPGQWSDPGYAPSEYHPVMCVSWKDAQAYIAWLNKQTGKQYRLPSEAEWEYAARAGSAAQYISDDSATEVCRYANVLDHSARRARKRDLGRDINPIDCDDQTEATSMVGMYQANAFGLHDMTGNVSEWVEDCQHVSYDGAPATGIPWTRNCFKMDNEKMYIHRGGSYSSGVKGARISARGHGSQDNASSLGEGFRLASDILKDTAQACKAGKSTPCANTSRSASFEAKLAAAQAASRAQTNTSK